MTDRQAQAHDVKFITPPNRLREKVGFGGMEPTRLERAENFIDENELDFTPYAEDLMERIERLIAQVRAGEVSNAIGRDSLIRAIMEIKANGGMFRFMLLSEIADVILNFLENIDDINDDALDIIVAHQNTMKVIVLKKLQGSGGKEGQALAQELFAACQRYYDKHDIELKG